ncbi:unnamed protein product [Linum tenue]|uniref:Uncharacterized protein n=1 Tax=Linum tenue TaxID=586396 RepID=A0AAV0N7A8_9ROSI|nr:unnamed protein product [Linum tenue]
MGGGEISGEVIGIDLGTTFSCVAVARKGHAVEIITNDQGNRTTPSYVAFSPPAAGYTERLIGESAKNQAVRNPRRTILDLKRLIGKKFDDPEVQNDLKYLPYPVVNRDGKPCVEVEVNGELKTFTAEEISAMVLLKMKETAESYLGKEVTKAVVTVPAYFNDSQRQATKDAGIIAGLNVVRIINEPTAAALAYGVKQDPDTKRNILVYDLGGGTFDVSVLEINNGIFQVRATGGDTHLGGRDFDQNVIDYFVDRIRKRFAKDVSEDDPKAMAKLRRECERAKKVLSTQTQTTVEIDSLIQGMDDFSEPFTRATFEDLNMNLFKRTLDVVKSTLVDAKLDKDEIDEIVLIGGSTRIPRVREMLKKAFDGKEPSKGINPDEAVAYGAAVYGASLNGDQGIVRTGVILFDVTPLSLGIRILNNLMHVVVPRNTVIPTKKSRAGFVPAKPVHGQRTSVSIQIFQGERALTNDCLLLGSFTLTGVPSGGEGEPSIEVTFEVDADGILSVTAKYGATGGGNSKTLTIDSYTRNLSSREIERMIREGREMAEQDKKERTRVNARNRLERHIHDLKEALADDKLDDHLEDGIKTAAAKRALREVSEWFGNNKSTACAQEYEDRSQKLEDLFSQVFSDGQASLR